VTPLGASPLGREALDDPHFPESLARATLEDIATVNRLFGGRAAAGFGLDRLLAGVPPGSRVSLLDVGAGAGDVASALRRRASRRGVDLVPVAVDTHRAAASLCAAAGLATVVAGVEALPVREGGVDLILASQFLHHFSRAAAAELIAAFDRTARLGVIVAEPRRSVGAMAGIWMASLALRLHPITRRDGVLSVRRSFTARELLGLLVAAGINAPVWRRPGFRLVAAWRPAHAHR
jgi:SAM-dependent methyltransferase